MKRPIESLIGMPLDWAVAQLAKQAVNLYTGQLWMEWQDLGTEDDGGGPTHVRWCPSTNAGQAWPVLEPYRLALLPVYESGRTESGIQVCEFKFFRALGRYSPHLYRHMTQAQGPTALIAGLRCALMIEHGREIEVPDEFTGE